ncbi:hypothetical protein D3C76_1485810 [compost metagenome]
MVILIHDLLNPLKHLIEKGIRIGPLIRIIKAKADSKCLLKSQTAGNGIGHIIVLLHNLLDLLPCLLGNAAAPVQNTRYRSLVDASEVGYLLDGQLLHVILSTP